MEARLVHGELRFGHRAGRLPGGADLLAFLHVSCLS